MNSFPAEVQELVQSNYQLILAALVGYFVVFLIISVAAKRQLAEEAGDYIVASRNLGWLVVTFTMFASVLSGVGMAGLPGTVYTFGAPFMVSILAGNSIAAMLMWYVGPRIWVLGKHYHFTTPGDLLGEYYQSDTIRLYTVFASLLYNLVYIVAQLLAGGILLNVLSGNTLSPALGSIIIAVIVVVHVVSSGLRGIAWLDLFNGLLILAMLILYGLSILSAAGGPGGVVDGLGAIRDRFITVPGLQGVYTPSYIYGIAIGLSIALAGRCENRNLITHLNGCGLPAFHHDLWGGANDSLIRIIERIQHSPGLACAVQGIAEATASNTKIPQRFQSAGQVANAIARKPFHTHALIIVQRHFRQHDFHQHGGHLLIQFNGDVPQPQPVGTAAPENKDIAVFIHHQSAASNLSCGVTRCAGTAA